MKIAYLCAGSGIQVFGNKGASVHIRDMVSKLKKLGNKIFIFMSYKNGTRI